jgi:hypothetical protein
MSYLLGFLRSRHDLGLKILALRQQLAVFKLRHSTPHLRRRGRLFGRRCAPSGIAGPMPSSSNEWNRSRGSAVCITDTFGRPPPEPSKGLPRRGRRYLPVPLRHFADVTINFRRAFEVSSVARVLRVDAILASAQSCLMPSSCPVQDQQAGPNLTFASAGCNSLVC